MKILIVDDEAGTRLMVATAVERLGHRALQAGDGDEGWAAFELHRPEVVITDWAMPGLDGTQLIARIRAAEGDYAYIMLLSGRVDEGASREAMRAGADDVLSKPPDPAELERGLIAAERITTMHRRMRDDARRDPLTGAGSRLRLDEDLAALCARVARYGHAYCLALIAIEPAGDDAVRARRRGARRADPLGRRAVPLGPGAVRRPAAGAGARDREPGRRPGCARRRSPRPRPGPR